MTPLFTPPHFLSKSLAVLAFLVALVKSNFGIAQNPMVISDSLIVQQRLYAKEKLIVDQEAKFKQDIVVQGDARMKSDVRIDSVLRVDGNARFNGNVRMDGIGEAPSLDSTIQVLVVLPNGQVKKTTIPGLGIYGAYQPIYCPPGDVPNPNWQNGLNKIFSPCPPVNVGIGTSDPLHKLHVLGNTYTRTFLAGNAGATYAALFNGFALNSSQDLMRLGIKIGSTTEEVRFKILNDGTVFAKEIRIRAVSDFPDYVFEQEYQLMSLNDLSLFITTNKRLPNMPSAEEVKSKGMNMGELTIKIVEKVEELTLYTIQLHQQNEKLQSEIDQLKAEMNEIKALLNEK